MTLKNNLRKIALEKRKLLDCNKLSNKIMQNLTSLPKYKESKHIISYSPLKYEVDTRYCNQDKTKDIYLPRVNGDNLDICPCSDLCKGSFGILEPQSSAIIDYSYIDMVLIPACAVDKNGYRLGYGKGFYDRFLPLLPANCLKVVLIFSELLFDTVYPDKYDVKSDIIITEKEIIKT